jgi:hypothetical protein
MNPETLKARIRTRIHDGDLPCQEEHQLFSGKSAGSRCDGCGEPIGTEEVVYEIVLVYTALGETTSFSMHTACYDVWRDECARPAPIS